MNECPACGIANLAGADPCEHCGQPLGGDDVDLQGDVEQHILSDPLSGLAPLPAPSVGPEATVGDALERLAGDSRGCVLVVEEERAIGIFSERDAVMRLVPGATDALARPVTEVMTPAPETLDDDAPVAFALQRMAGGGYRHIPVMRDGVLCGLLSARDILRYICETGLGPER